MINSWIAKPTPLNFLFGEIPLFSVTFPSLVLDVHFTKLPSDPLEPRPPFEKFSSGLEALFIRSHPVERELPRLALLPQSIRYVPIQYRHYYIDLQGSFSDYLKKFSAKSRSTLNRKMRKFAEFSGGKICWREFCYPEEMEDFHRLAREVSKKTYQERLLDAGISDSDRFRQKIADLATRDLLRAYILFYGERPIAYLCCPAREDILLYQYTGYDPEFQSWSPGTILQYLTLERLFAEGRFRLLDLNEGEGPHKEFFSTGSIQCANIYYFRRTLRNLVLLLLHTGLFTFSGATVKVLDSLGLKTRIKNFFRSKAGK